MDTRAYTEELNKQIEELISAKEILLFGTMIMGRIAQRVAEYLGTCDRRNPCFKRG